MVHETLYSASVSYSVQLNTIHLINLHARYRVKSSSKKSHMTKALKVPSGAQERKKSKQVFHLNGHSSSLSFYKLKITMLYHSVNLRSSCFLIRIPSFLSRCGPINNFLRITILVISQILTLNPETDKIQF